MNEKVQPMILGYGFALVSTVLATWLRALIHPYVGEQVPFVTYFPAVFATAMCTRLGPTLLAVALSVLTAAHLFLVPANSLVPGDAAAWTGLALFSLFGVGAGLLSERMRRRADQIQRERERYAVTLSSIGDAVIVTEEYGRITFLNGVAVRLTGWTVEEAQQKPLENVFCIVNERTREPSENPVAKALREGRAVGLANHTILIAKDGTERAIDDSAAPIRAQDGRIVGGVLVFRDVSDQRASHIDRGRLAALVNSSEDAILGQTFEGVVTTWNAGAERLFGYSAEEIVGQPVFSTIVPPERKDELLQVLGRIQQGERVAQFETIRQCKDGRRLAVGVRISPIYDGEGEVIGASAIDRDISQQRAAERRRSARLAVNQILAHERDIAKAIADALAGVCTALEWSVGCFWRLDPAEQVLRCQEFWQHPSGEMEEFRATTMKLAFERGTGLPARVWHSGQSAWIPDVVVEPHFVRASVAERCGLHGGFACPVAVDDKLLGIIEFFSQEIREPDADLMELMATIGGQIGQFIERRESERKLRRSEQELSDFFENAAVGLHRVGPDGTILRANQTELDMLGYTLEEYVGHHVAAFHVDQSVIEHLLQSLAAGKQFHDYEARLRCKDGTIKHVLIDSNVLWEDGRLIHSRGFTRDITQRKRLEQSLQFLAEASQSLASLVDYKSTLQKVAHLAVPAFADWCTVDMVAADGSLERMTVAHADPAKIQLAEELARSYPPDPNALQGAMKVIRTGESVLTPAINDSMLEEAARDDEHLRILRELKLNSYMCVPLAAKHTTIGVMSFVSGESGRVYGPDDLAMAEDLARRAAIAIENAQLYQRVREADRRKDEFLAMLAHELRNPLAPIRSGLGILAMDAGREEETIALMQEQVEHMVRLVDDLLDVSRIMQGKVELRREPVELAVLVKRSVEAVRPRIEGHQQELVVSLPEQAVWLNADPVRLVQVIENLLHNASKYMDAGGQIKLAASVQDAQVVISVSDTGIGIEEELLPKVFELFTQSSRSLDRSLGGLGIGLTLVQRLVHMHGGTVTAFSDGPGHGSTFVVRLPVTEIPLQFASPTVHTPAARARRIAVVDDNVSAAWLLSKLLTKLGDHEVVIAHDGPSALTAIQENHPEVVLLDIGLPGMDGYEVGRRIRENPEFDDVLLVALTGYGQEEDRRRTKQAGFDVHLVKPPSLEQLRGILAHPKLQQN